MYTKVFSCEVCNTLHEDTDSVRECCDYNDFFVQYRCECCKSCYDLKRDAVNCCDGEPDDYESWG